MKDLVVHWQCLVPPVEPSSWFEWTFIPTRAGGDSHADAAVERGLGWAEGTMAVLRAAFSQNFGRRTGWFTNSAALVQPLSCAARVFRRGVAFQTEASAWSQKPSSGSYKIAIKNSTPAEFIKHLARSQKPAPGFVIDAALIEHWPVLSELKNSLVLPIDEVAKNLDTVVKILSDKNLSRAKTWTIIGGGVLSDTAAFAAALAGKSFTFIPTTLLAMADACVGGKTGVNFPPYGKNQIGLFAFPKAVEIWPAVLSSLSPRERHAGISECLKHAILSGNTALLGTLSKEATADHTLSPQTIAEVIAVKSAVVGRDPTEAGERAILNFGHTLAHALEGISQECNPRDHISHGEAVAVGMLFGLALSVSQCNLPKADAALIQKALVDSGCVLKRQVLERYLGYELGDNELADKVLHLMSQDKKSSSPSEFQFVLLSGFGKINNSERGFLTALSHDVVRQAWRDFCKAY